ncbi:MAG: type II secretion system protein [Verrucomicrobiae bacterium]|nr:type II secretion system protein [Verrucomicrobiae bacterium]
MKMIPATLRVTCPVSPLTRQNRAVFTPCHLPSSILHPRRAFTLVELLIVISIIGVLAGFIIAALGPIKVHKATSAARGELAQIETALENYHAKYGVYPPCNQNPDTTPAYANASPNVVYHSQMSQLYYELSGTTNDGVSFVTLDGSDSVPVNGAKNVMAAYGVGGFINCSKGSGDETVPAKNFLLSLSSKQVFRGYTNNGPITSMLVTSVNGPDDTYTPLNARDANPVRYLYPGINNPTSYDLWVQLQVGGKKYLVCNWAKAVQVNTADH